VSSIGRILSHGKKSARQQGHRERKPRFMLPPVWSKGDVKMVWQRRVHPGYERKQGHYKKTRVPWNRGEYKCLPLTVTACKGKAGSSSPGASSPPRRAHFIDRRPSITRGGRGEPVVDDAVAVSIDHVKSNFGGESKDTRRAESHHLDSLGERPVP